MTIPNALVSCVGENRDDWFPKIQNLVLSLRRSGGTMSGARVVVNLVGGAQASYVRALGALGAEVRVVEPMDPRLPTSNKLRMLELATEAEFDVLVMLDCDVIVSGDLTGELDTRVLRAAPAGKSHLPPSAWALLYRELGLEEPQARMTLASGERSHPYYNTGVLVVPRGQCAVLLEHWYGQMQRFFELAAAVPTLATFRKDQIPFACAIASAALEVDLLPLNLNLSTTRARSAPAFRHQSGPPFILHYHNAIDAHGFLQASPNSAVDRELDRFNRNRSEELGIAYPGMTGLSMMTRAKAQLAAQSWFWQAKHRYLRARKLVTRAAGVRSPSQQ